MLDSIIIKGFILLQSGLHIGGTEAGIHIGGIDSPVTKNPVTGFPYIPGSSLKGKMRFLLEHSLIKNIHSLVHEKKTIPSFNSNYNNIIPILFGNIDHSKETDFMPTRIIFRDSQIVGILKNFNNDCIDINDIDKNIDQIRKDLGSDFVEAKTEVSIDRLSGTVGNSGPRQIERVPAGVVFGFEIVLRSFKDNEQEKHLTLVKKGLKLIENDALGGSGSRGSGKVKFFGLKKYTENNSEDFSLE